MIENIVAAIGMVFRLDNMLGALAGVTIGMVVGAIPGLTGNMAICILLPFTFYLKPIVAIATLMGISKGGYFGGAIPAILFRLPGTPEAMITSFDGYELAKQGKSGKALKMALYASTMSDVQSDLVLFFLIAPVASFALMIGPSEYAMIVLFSLVILAVTSTEDILRGMIAIGIGLLLATVGLDPGEATPRLTFGSTELIAGIQLVPLMIGLLIVSEAFSQLEQARVKKGGSKKAPLVKRDDNPENHRVSFTEFKQCSPHIVIGSAIGSALGAIPGIGATIAGYLSYVRAKTSSKHPELFGKGSLEGVAAAESGDNGVSGPNLIPLITLGIPGNLAAALILGAFMLQGLTPGPFFMQKHAPMLYALFIVLIISNAFAFAVGMLLIRLARYLVYAPVYILYPLALVFGAVGTYIFRHNLFDLIMAFSLGVFGYILKKSEIPILAVIVAFILGKIFEERLLQSLVIFGGNTMLFLTRPISLVFFIMTIAVPIALIIMRKRGINPIAC